MNNALSDPAAERGVLAGVFTYGNNAYLDVADILNNDTFTIDSNQYIWSCLTHAFEKNQVEKIDYPTLISSANSLGLSSIFDKEEEKAHLRAVMNFPIKLENIRKLAGKIKKLEVARKLQKQLDIASQSIFNVTGDESIDSILALAEEPISDLTSALMSGSDGPKLVGDGLNNYIKFLEENQRTSVGIPSGFRLYDKAIGGGFRPGTINVIGARVKIGKSFIGMNVAVRVSSGAYYDWPKVNIPNGVPVLVLDTEMTKEDQWIRMLSMVSGVKIDDIETGMYAKNYLNKKKVKDAGELLNKLPYEFLSIAGQPFEETLSTMKRWITKKVGFNEDGSAKPCLIIFDYIKLMTSEAMSGKNMQEYQVLGFMMTGLHNLAVRYKVPILTFVQLNREGIDTEDTSVASGSDRIVWLCSNFSIFKKKTDEEIAENINSKFNRKLVPVVARHGAGLEDKDYINMTFSGAVGNITEGPTRYQLANNSNNNDSKNQGFVVNDTRNQEESVFGPG